MPKPVAPKKLPVNKIINSLTASAQSMMSKNVNNSVFNTSVLFNHIYKILNDLDDTLWSSPATDWEILRFLNAYRYPNVTGDTRSGRLLFDFTMTADLFGSPKDLASLAMHFKHPETLLCFLQEEQLTWSNDEQLMKGLSRALEPDGLTWLHKSMILASLVHDRYAAYPLKQLELKEFLQNSMQVYTDLMGKYPRPERINILRNIAILFNKMFEAKTLALIPLVFPIRLLKNILEEIEYEALISDLCSDKKAAIEEIATTYSLDADSLSARNKQLAQMGKNFEQEQFDADKAYLNIRFRLSIFMKDRILFNQCILNAFDLSMEVLIKSIYVSVYNQINFTIQYFLTALPANIRKKTLDFLFVAHSNKCISTYIPSCELDKQKIYSLVLSLQLYIAIQNLGDRTYQYQYVHALLQTAITHKLSNLIETLIDIFREADSTISTIKELSKLPEAKGARSIPPSIKKYPILEKTYAGKYNEFHKHILKSIEKAETDGLKAQDTWFAYLSFMHMSLTLDESSINPDFLKTARLYFQILEYWFDELLANKAKYATLWAKMQSCLLETNYFSSGNLKSLFIYRFGELSDIGLELEKTRLALSHELSFSKIEKQYGRNLVKYLKDSEDQPLLKDLTAMFQSKKGLIEEQVNFVRHWILWAESLEEKLGIKPDKYKVSKSSRLIVDILINQTPLAKQLFMLSGTASSPSLFLDGLKADDPSFKSSSSAIKFVKSLVFDAYSSKMFFVLFLFLNKSEHKIVYHLLTNLLPYINYATKINPSITIQYQPFYEVMAKNNFFQHELDSLLIKIFYINNLFKIPPAEEAPKTSTLDTQETPISEKKPKKKKKKHTNPESSIEETEKTPKPEAHEEFSATPSMALPIMEAKDVQPPAAVDQKSILPSMTLSEETMIESIDSSSEGGSSDEVEESEETIAKKTALRKTQQQLYLIFKYLIIWVRAKIAQIGTESIQAIQYNALINLLETNQVHLRKIRTFVKKFSVDPLLPAEPHALSLSAFEYLENYASFIDKMKELAAEIKGSEQITSLIQDLMIISPEDLIQLQLLEHLMLPNMPIVTKITALFSEHAKVSISGTSLFLSNPMDIDFCLEMKNEALTQEEALALFESIIMRASREEGLDFQIIFSKLFLGIASVTIKAKGDGYGLHNYKSMDFTLQVADPSKRLAKLHHTTHSAATLDLISGKILCSPEIAQAIIQGVFKIHPAALVDPVERYKMNVHVLTTVMRAWIESKLRPLQLDESVLCLIQKIKQYKGDQTKFHTEEADLDKALIGMITRHFKHFEYNNTYAYRTSMLIAFLTELGMHELISSGAAQAFYTIILNELEQFRYGQSTFIKTERYLRFCAIHPVTSFETKEHFKKILSRHFNQHRNDLDYLQKTQSLLDLCKRLGFNLIIQDKSDAVVVFCDLLSVNLIEGFMIFSPPRLSIDDASLLIVNAPRLLDSNQHAIITALLNQVLIKSSPSEPTLISELGYEGFAPHGVERFFGATTRHSFFSSAPYASGGPDMSEASELPIGRKGVS